MLPKLARRPPLSEILRARGRDAPARERVREGVASLFLPSVRSFSFSLSLARSLDVKREILNKTGCY